MKVLDADDFGSLGDIAQAVLLEWIQAVVPDHYVSEVEVADDHFVVHCWPVARTHEIPVVGDEIQWEAKRFEGSPPADVLALMREAT